MLALDGNIYSLDENILVIADAKKPVAIAGIMGGEETGVHKETKRVVFEIANFDPIVVRKGEHQLALSSDSSMRFNKGLPVQLPEFAATRLAELAEKIAFHHNAMPAALLRNHGDASHLLAATASPAAGRPSMASPEIICCTPATERSAPRCSGRRSRPRARRRRP